MKIAIVVLAALLAVVAVTAQNIPSEAECVFTRSPAITVSIKTSCNATSDGVIAGNTIHWIRESGDIFYGTATDGQTKRFAAIDGYVGVPILTGSQNVDIGTAIGGGNCIDQMIGSALVLRDANNNTIDACVVRASLADSSAPLTRVAPYKAACYLLDANTKDPMGMFEFTQSGATVETRGYVLGLASGPSTVRITPSSAGALPDRTVTVADNGAGKYLNANDTEVSLSLSSSKSIIGATISVISGGNTMSYCTVGILPDPVPSFPYSGAGKSAQVIEANCIPTVATAWEQIGNIDGIVQFLRMEGKIRVRYYLSISNSPSSANHTMHVHENGNLCTKNATATGGHYVGTCSKCRAGAAAQEVGNLNDGIAFAASNGIAVGFFDDMVISMNGVDSIIGRSIVIHGNGTAAAPRVAQCVIGATRYAANNALDDDYTDSKMLACRVSGQTISGGFVFAEVADGINVTYALKGMTGPSYPHHIHLLGDITSLAATRGHFVGSCSGCRPDGKLQEIGLLNDGIPITPDANGNAIGTYLDSKITLTIPAGSAIVGRSLVIHDNTTARVASCVIGLYQPKSTAVDPYFCLTGAVMDEAVTPAPTESSASQSAVFSFAVVAILAVIARLF